MKDFYTFYLLSHGFCPYFLSQKLRKGNGREILCLHGYENVSYCQPPTIVVRKMTKSQFLKRWDRSGQRSKTEKTGLRPMHVDVRVVGRG